MTGQRPEDGARIQPPAKLGDELRFLARLHPREIWTDHAWFGQLAQFWLLGGIPEEAKAGARQRTRG